MDNDDIWSGSSLKKSGDPVSSWETAFMINRGRFRNQEASGLSTILMCVGLAIFTIIAVYFSVCGPSMWHNSLVVCSRYGRAEGYRGSRTGLGTTSRGILMDIFKNILLESLDEYYINKECWIKSSDVKKLLTKLEDAHKIEISAVWDKFISRVQELQMQSFQNNMDVLNKIIIPLLQETRQYE